MSEHRLPRHVHPTHYDITLEPDLETLSFQGAVGVEMTVTEATDTIVLNSAEIEVKSFRLTGDGATADIAELVYDEEAERIAFHLEEPLAPGDYRLEIDYSGTINDQLRGLYKSVYRDPEGNQHLIATSQCQAIDARRVFPGWDEPDFKATFQTTMVVADGLEAYSNTREIGREPTDDGRVRFEFAKSMKMSPYLLAFIAGPFEATEPAIVRGTPIRIIVPRGNLHLTEVALDNAVFCFEYLSDYYRILYPGDKLDHIAIPDFAAGAMENVGLITYRDTYLIIDPEKASQSELQNSLDVIGHEIAHQWFGNLVTMAWWEGAWLNEAFASFMELKATDAKHPGWKRWLAFANLEVPWAMGTDQLATTRPIEFEVNAPEEVEEMFDAITYGKGSAVLRMIEQFIGVEAFREGVGNYLHKHEYANTVTTDLWEGLDQASDWPVSEIMGTWVYQRGFPQVGVERVPGGIRLAQHRYLAIPDDTDSTIWKVPIRLRGFIGGAPFDTTYLLGEEEGTVELPGAPEWVTANAGGHGFYRARYSDHLFRSLLDNLDDLDDIERHSLVSDTVAFVRNGQVSADYFLDLVSLFQDEMEQAVWSVIIGGLGIIEHHALSEEARPDFEGFVRDLLGPALDELGWSPREAETDLQRKLRGELIAAKGNLGEDEVVISRCDQLVAELLDGASMDPEITTAALAVYARHGGVEEYQTLWNAYQEAATPLEQVRYLRSVAAVETPELAVATLDKIVEGDIRTQDGFWVFARLLGGDAGPDVWKSARSRWDEVLAAMPGLTRRRVVEGLPALSQPEVALDVQAFFAEHPIPEATRALSQRLELLRANLQLRQREAPVVTDYFTPNS
ncbi:MAG: M1 family metallopeptidase [Actinobacteria bacterium]|nr:M1 family metallopeptidase [Actinomycetota bacterium]